MFIVQDYKLKHETRTQAYWDIRLVLHRNNGKEIVYNFRQSTADFLGKVVHDKVIELDLYEMKETTPCLLLMCAEEKSILTKFLRNDRCKIMNVVTITEDDNSLSEYGRAKWKRCIRNASDCAFFAGPCTGGSPWNRLNKNVSELTAHSIRPVSYTHLTLPTIYSV